MEEHSVVKTHFQVYGAQDIQGSADLFLSLCLPDNSSCTSEVHFSLFFFFPTPLKSFLYCSLLDFVETQ